MAGSHQSAYEDAPAPEGPEIPAPRRAHDYDFLIPMMMEIQKTNASLCKAIDTLSNKIEGIGKKIDKVDDIGKDIVRIQCDIAGMRERVDDLKTLPMSMATLVERVDTVKTELGSTKDKLDKVRTWVIGAAAVVSVVAVAATIGARFFPASQPATQTSIPLTPATPPPPTKNRP